MYYVFLDEIQKVAEIRVNPLSFREFCSACEGDKNQAWSEYCTYGGMPLVLTRKSHDEKSKYLKDLFTRTYLTDVLERHRILNDKEVLEDLLNILSSSVGSLTNPTKLANTFSSMKHLKIAPNTIGKYLDYFTDAFIISRSARYDIKRKKYIDSPLKYFFTDVGLRNARLNFRQQEENHIMENVLFNELVMRGYDVDVGVVEYNYRNSFGKSKREQEINSLKRIGDSFRKIVVVRDPIIPWHDDNGILYIGIEQFLLDEKAMDA